MLFRPAEAEKFKLEKLAEAHKLKTVLEAEAEAEAVKVRGEVSNTPQNFKCLK